MDADTEMSSWLGKPVAKGDAGARQSSPSTSDSEDEDSEMRDAGAQEQVLPQIVSDVPQPKPEKKRSAPQVEPIDIDSEDNGSPVDLVTAGTVSSDNEPRLPRRKITSVTKHSTFGSTSRAAVRVKRQPGLSIDIPQLEDGDKEEFERLPGHDEVRHVLRPLLGNNYLVRLASGELEMVTTNELSSQLVNGKQALHKYKLSRIRNQQRNLPELPLRRDGTLDWNSLDLSHIDPSATSSETPPRRSYRISVSRSNDDQDSEDDFTAAANRTRRSDRATRSRPADYAALELVDFIDDEDDSDAPRRKRLRRAKDEDINPSRRSERTRHHPRMSMRERHEDDLSSQSEKSQAIKVTGAREFFTKVSEGNPFRRRHQQECAVCAGQGDLHTRGPLVFCQGCTHSYHKACLGSRGTRDHLVTKVGEQQFVLQCRRCIGAAREKDKNAPHHGKCSACDKFGNMSKPLRSRLTPTQEQVLREQNGGVDPITTVQPSTIDNIKNVMFRCTHCLRSWHMHHLPMRKTATSQPGDSDEEGLADAEKAQKRFDLYHRSWTCKDCIEFQSQTDTVVAWRPVDQESYVPGTTLDQLQESEKEYLIKWKNQSYLRCDWMPGNWVWGVVAGASRIAFAKKPENQLPRMTTTDAIPEEFHRIDIVFDVKYTSIVRNSSEQIDYVRVKEVDTAFVKYKGLPYEDAIWEKPPNYTETERWEDFKSAYEDYVKKRYMSIPPQSSLRRRLAEARTKNFGTELIKNAQPTIMTGGEMMKYQLEGHNWLYYQWYRQHNAILADEMGLGKTIQLIALMTTLIQDLKCWPFLLVVPNSTCPNWRREIKKWVPSIRAVCYYGSAAARKLTHDFELFPKEDKKEIKDVSGPQLKKRKEPKNLRAHIVIASYESIIEERARLSLMRVPWQGLIVDEGQRLKSDKNQVYEALLKFNFPFKVLMTGTPLQNNARELFNLLQFLDKDKHDAAELEEKYAELTQENVPELHELLKPYFLRRTKVQVLTFLPPMSQVIVPVSMSALQKKVSKSILAQNPQLMKSLFSRTEGVPVKDRANLNNMLMQLRKTLCHPFVYSRELEDRKVDSDTSFRTLVEASSKLQLLSLMLPKLRERGHRVLMFSQFLDNLDIVEDFLDGMGMLHRRLDGSINALEKQKRIDDFNAPDSPYFAFLLSTRAGGVGINLATADTVIILDPDFNPHQDIQALSRAHRIGQSRKVLVFQLMTRASAEEKIMQIGKKKMALDHVLIESMDQADDAGVDLESILKHGAEALFADDGEADIIYTEASVDGLLDRSQVESTKTSDGQTAESQFSFAKIWSNDKAGLEEGLEDSNHATPDPGMWDKIILERERAYEEEAARKATELGRGKRKRGQVDYRGKIRGEGIDKDQEQEPADVLEVEDEDFEGASSESTSSDSDDSQGEPEDVLTAPRPANHPLRHVERTPGHIKHVPHLVGRTPGHNEHVTRPVGTAPRNIPPPSPQTVRARPFIRVQVPTGNAPHFNGAGSAAWAALPVPNAHHCMACQEWHPMGWCRLKIAGVEHCGLCGMAHIGAGRTCPHFCDEAQVETLLLTLKDSTEPRELVDEAIKYLKILRSELVYQRRGRERRELLQQQQQQKRQQEMQQAAANQQRPVMPPLPSYSSTQPGGPAIHMGGLSTLRNAVGAVTASVAATIPPSARAQ